LRGERARPFRVVGENATTAASVRVSVVRRARIEKQRVII
jgi:hypothetical protein